MSAIVTVAIRRGDGENSVLQEYQVPLQDSQTVLDLVTTIQRSQDPSLAYRFACRVGMCGSCAMTVNGVPRWTCRTHVAKVIHDGAITIEPLRGFPVVKDLVVDMTDFFDHQQRAEGVFHPTRSRDDEVAPISPASKLRQLADAAVECIGCGVCVASCEIAAGNPAYLGPAALNRAWALHNDARDGAKTQRLAAIAGDAGCHGCASHRGCSDLCPKHLDPSLSIAGLKRASAWLALKGAL
jgi:fumarate reductase iron-sulfur subunit